MRLTSVKVCVTPLLALFIVLLSLSLLPVLPAHAEVRTATVGVYENAPKVFTSHGKPAGIFIDILEEIAHKEGWRLKYRHGTWSEGLNRLAIGESCRN